jgi:hypothetical protein
MTAGETAMFAAVHQWHLHQQLLVRGLAGWTFQPSLRHARSYVDHEAVHGRQQCSIVYVIVLGCHALQKGRQRQRLISTTALQGGSATACSMYARSRGPHTYAVAAMHVYV